MFISHVILAVSLSDGNQSEFIANNLNKLSISVINLHDRSYIFALFVAILSVVAGVTVYAPMETESVTLNVNVVGTASQITWYKNDQLISISNRYSGGNVSVPALTISNVKVTDGGDYVCEITNGKDTVRTSIIQLSPLCESFLFETTFV